MHTSLTVRHRELRRTEHPLSQHPGSCPESSFDMTGNEARRAFIRTHDELRKALNPHVVVGDDDGDGVALEKMTLRQSGREMLRMQLWTAGSQTRRRHVCRYFTSLLDIQGDKTLFTLASLHQLLTLEEPV